MLYHGLVTLLALILLALLRSPLPVSAQCQHPERPRNGPENRPYMPDTSAPDTAPMPAGSPPKRRRRRSAGNASLAKRIAVLEDADGRTIAVRRVRDFRAAIESDLGGPEHVTATQAALIVRCAMVATFCEACETRWLSGE